MKCLVVGGGGREHAIFLALERDGAEVYAAPGNAGIPEARRVGKDVDLLAWCRGENIGLVVVGPEAPLVEGLADRLREAGIPAVGPSAQAAALEGDKSFSRDVADAASVPGPKFAVLKAGDDLKAALSNFGSVPVVKAAGLAAGKGVFMCESETEALEQTQALLDGALGAAGHTVVWEERLVGLEASIFYAVRDSQIVALPHAVDHKRLLDGDQGPNTGGMGALSPNPHLDAETVAQVQRDMVEPVLTEMAQCGRPYSGFLFVGVMLTEAGPKLLEYNCRLGDPETQVVLPRLSRGEFLALCRFLAGVDKVAPTLSPRPTQVCGVVLASKGYPQKAEVGVPIHIDAPKLSGHQHVVHAGTRREGEQVLTSGGRVLSVVAEAPSRDEAIAQAYAALDHVRFEGQQYRKDIGR